MSRLPQDLLVTACALTHTTEFAAHWLGVGYFLPALFVDRFSKLGGIDSETVARHLRDCRSFRDGVWSGYWRRLADAELAGTHAALARQGGPAPAELADPSSDTISGLADVLSPAVSLLADRSSTAVESFAARQPEHADSAVALTSLVRGMTYLFAAAWPGWTPRRLAAYRESRQLFDLIVRALAPVLRIEVEAFEIDLDDDVVSGYTITPSGAPRSPGILICNGLEGSIQEVGVPVLGQLAGGAFDDVGAALVLMEMPGTFAYRHPLSTDSERYFTAVLDYMSSHPRINPDQLGMVGLSFGAYWSTRMAAHDPRLKGVVSNGGLYHHGFAPRSVLGMPEILLSTLRSTLGARNLLDLGRRMHDYPIEHLYGEIPIPILAMNGDHDTLVPTRDTVELAAGAPRGELKLYPDDDHCAMGHYDEFIADAIGWARATAETT